MRRIQGLTLVEILIVMSLLAVLTTIALPLFRDVLQEARMTAAVNALVHSIHLAHQNSHTSGREVVLCRSIDGAGCLGSGDWGDGWIVFANLDRDDPPVVDSDEPVLQTSGPQALHSITSNRRSYVVRPFSLRSTNGTVIFCDRRGSARARAVILSYTGRPRVSRQTADGHPLSCPG